MTPPPTTGQEMAPLRGRTLTRNRSGTPQADNRSGNGPATGPNPDQNGDLAARIAALFHEGGSSLMLDMDLEITHAEPGFVRFALPVAERLTHGGGVLCGQAIMACTGHGDGVRHDVAQRRR